MVVTPSVGVHLQSNGDGSVTLVDEGGAQLVFPSNGSGGYTAALGSGDTLTTSGAGWQLKRRDQVLYTFNGAGQVTAIADRNSNSLAFAYQSGELATVTDTVGRVATFGYTNGLLTSVSGPQSQSITYGYDASGRLSTVVDVRGKTWTYTYDANDLLRTIVDPNSHTVVTNTYGPTGRVTEQVDARGKHTTFDWDPVTETATMTDARGGIWSDVYHSNVLMSRSDPLGNETRFVYDDKLNLVVVSDPRGNATAMTYDANRNVLTKTPPGLLNLPAEVWTSTPGTTR